MCVPIRCFKCKKKRPDSAPDAKLAVVEAAKAAEDHGWREALDPTTKQVYYYHTTTGETQWENPFGRPAAAEQGDLLPATTTGDGGVAAGLGGRW